MATLSCMGGGKKPRTLRGTLTLWWRPRVHASRHSRVQQHLFESVPLPPSNDIQWERQQGKRKD